MKNTSQRTERFIQFGEGGFLRGFADWMIQKLNDKTGFEGSVVVIQPRKNGKCHLLTSQGCRYTHIIRGKEGTEKEVIDIISRCIDPYVEFQTYLELAAIPSLRYIISNTTEAGITFCRDEKASETPPASFPGKLTLLLKRRFDLGLPGFIFLPCELIHRNGEALKKCILQYAELWQLGEAFVRWIEKENDFCCTLVDRINTGYPHGEAIETPFPDKMLNASEHFHLWVIETTLDLNKELPFKEAGLNVIVTNDELEKYHTRKVRILNGAHTAFVPYALLEGFETVQECVEDEAMRSFIHNCIFEEIIPTLDLPEDELNDYANSVLLRFENPYIRHELSSIALNSVSKFKVRVLPSILAYKDRFGTYPKNLMLSLKKLLEFYKFRDLIFEYGQDGFSCIVHSIHMKIERLRVVCVGFKRLSRIYCVSK